MEKTGCEIICGAPTTLAVKGLMMMMMMMKETFIHRYKVERTNKAEIRPGHARLVYVKNRNRSMLSTDGTSISASAAPHCGEGGEQGMQGEAQR